MHFDLNKVLDLIKYHITNVRTSSQRYILIEGLCNSSRLANVDDKMELRLMDELFAIEKQIGEVQGVIGLQYKVEPE